jgi:hypothetical protein
MKRFTDSNPGLDPRFTRFFEFPDYTAQELGRIFSLICRKYGLLLAADLKKKVLHHFHHLALERSGKFGNAAESANTNRFTGVDAAGSVGSGVTVRRDPRRVSPRRERLICLMRTVQAGSQLDFHLKNSGRTMHQMRLQVHLRVRSACLLPPAR